jgi:hypothetical protein
MRNYFFPLLAIATLFCTNARADFLCDKADGRYRLAFSADFAFASLTETDVHGAIDGNASLACDGPNESAYVCQGDFLGLDDARHHLELVAQESALQGAGAGTFKIDGAFYRCTGTPAPAALESPSILGDAVAIPLCQPGKNIGRCCGHDERGHMFCHGVPPVHCLVVDGVKHCPQIK